MKYKEGTELVISLLFYLGFMDIFNLPGIRGYPPPIVHDLEDRGS